MCTSRNQLQHQQQQRRRHQDDYEPYENSPESLLLLSAKKIIQDQVPFTRCSLPQEVGHLLMRQFRTHMRHQDTLYLETDQCERFYRQFKPEYISLSYIDFSELPITDKFLVEFVKRYRTMMIHLDISNCNRLTPMSFKKLNEIFSGHDLAHQLRKKTTRSHKRDPYSLSKVALNHQPQQQQQQHKYEHVYIGNGLVDRVPAKTEEAHLRITRPMRYITDFGRADSSMELDFDYDQYNFHNDSYDLEIDGEDFSESGDEDNEELYEDNYEVMEEDDNLDQARNGVAKNNDDNDYEMVETMDKRLCLQSTSNSRFIIDKPFPNIPHNCSAQSTFSNIALPSSKSLQGRDQQSNCSSFNYPPCNSRASNILKSSDKICNLDDINHLQRPFKDKKTITGTSKKSMRPTNDLNSTSNKLKTLILGETISRILPSHPDLIESALSSHLSLEKLVAHRIIDKDFISGGVIHHLLTPKMHNTLQHLDLSDSVIKEGSSLANLTSLKALILYNCELTYPKIVNNICRLKSLRVLDISQLKQQPDSNKENFEGALKSIIYSLPNLSSLDISGTQLVSKKDPEISGWNARQNKPFEFLGLFHTEDDASYRSNIPAETIAGDANESQILNACEVYMKRPDQLTKALNDLFVTFRIKSEVDEIRRASHIVLSAINNHLYDEHVLRAATALLFCICKSDEVIKHFSLKVKRLIVSRLLDAMYRHKQCSQILQNGTLTFINLIVTFKTQAWINECYRLAAITLHIINSNFNDEGVMQRHGVAVLNSLACQVGAEQKIIMADLEAIVHMIKLIKIRLAEGRCDDVLEAAWSTMWNITDESPVNCKRFLAERGLETFEQCMDKFPGSKDLIRNIMGLLGNVAECPDLRHHFMKERVIIRFTNLLNSADKIECSYNSCGILAHLMSDGQDFWNRFLKNFSRQHVLDQMRIAISSWRICEERSINYRSFVPIIRLLKPNLAPEVQYWAVWALTNLTRVYPSKYCIRLYKDGGHECLKLLMRSDTASYVKNLAQITLYQCQWFEDSPDGTLNGFEGCNSTDMEFIERFRHMSSFRESVMSDPNFMGQNNSIMQDDVDSD